MNFIKFNFEIILAIGCVKRCVKCSAEKLCSYKIGFCCKMCRTSKHWMGHKLRMGLKFSWSRSIIQKSPLSQDILLKYILTYFAIFEKCLLKSKVLENTDTNSKQFWTRFWTGPLKNWGVKSVKEQLLAAMIYPITSDHFSKNVSVVTAPKLGH